MKTLISAPYLELEVMPSGDGWSVKIKEPFANLPPITLSGTETITLRLEHGMLRMDCGQLPLFP